MRYNSTYDPYGKAKILDGAGVPIGSVSALGNPWTFTGRRLDAETVLMYYRSRNYDVALGRFISRDRIGYLPKSYNLYQYVNGHAPFSADPLGFGECDCCPDDCAKLKDSKDKINEWVNDAIAKAKKEGTDPGEGVAGGLGAGSPWTKVESDIDRLGDEFKKKKTKEETKYKGAGFQEGKLWHGFLGDTVLNPCILVCGKCIGSDKIGHFLQQGMQYYKKKKANQGDKDKGLGKAEQWSTGTEQGAFGLAGTGISSGGDLEANRQGGQFYEDLKNDPNMVFDICKYLKDNKWCEDGPKAPPGSSPNTYGPDMDKLVKKNQTGK